MKTLSRFSILLQLVSAIYLAPNAYSQEPTLKAVQEYPGCPTNSICSADMGALREKWMNTLGKYNHIKKPNRDILAFVKNHGFLIDFWTQKTKWSQLDPIRWDSACSLHKPSKDFPGIFRGEIFLKGTADQQALVRNLKGKIIRQDIHSEIVLDKLYVQSSKGVQQYFVPLGDVPYALDGKSLLVLREFNGDFYTLKIFPSGKWKLKATNFEHMARTNRVNCSAKLIKAAQKHPPLKNLYESTYCKTIKGIKNKQTYTYLARWSCNP